MKFSTDGKPMKSIAEDNAINSQIGSFCILNKDTHILPMFFINNDLNKFPDLRNLVSDVDNYARKAANAAVDDSWIKLAALSKYNRSAKKLERFIKKNNICMSTSKKEVKANLGTTFNY